MNTGMSFGALPVLSLVGPRLRGWPVTKRITAAMLAVLLLFSSVVTPARAFAPLAVLAAPVLVGGGGTSWGMGAALGVLGAAVGYLLIEDSMGNASRIPLTDKPESVVPSPSAPEMATPTAPASNGQRACIVNNTICANGATELSACSAVCGVQAVFAGFYYCPSGAHSGVVCSVGSVSLPPTCPSGYNASGSNCVLANPRQATPDKNCDMALSNGAFGYASDIDCPGAGTSIDHSKAVPVIRGEGKQLSIAGVDSQNRPVVIDVTRSADNTQTSVSQSVQSGPNVQTTTTTVSNATRQVTSVTTTTAPGQITMPQSSPATSTGSGTQADTPKVTTDPTKQPVLQFPDDYARENTAQRTATAVEKLLQTDPAPSDPTLPPSSGFGDVFFRDTFSGLTAFRLPAHTSQCPTVTFDYDLFTSHHYFVLDSHCTIAEQIRPAFSSVMLVVWALVALFVVLGA